MIDVSIILVNYNGLTLTRDCIGSIVASEGMPGSAISTEDSLLTGFSRLENSGEASGAGSACGCPGTTDRDVNPASDGLSYEIIVVDNGSVDGSVDALAHDSRITFIPMGRNAGFGVANNEGLKVASGRNVLFLNNDTIVRTGAVGKLSAFLDSHPRAGAVGGNLLAPATESVGECGPGRTLALTEAVSMSLSFPSVLEEIRGLFDVRPVSFNRSGREMEVAVISGADIMVRKSVLDAVGGFNPEFFMYYEDVELCWRIRKAGYSIWSLPSAEIIHIGGASSKPAEDDPYNIRRLRRKFDSRRKFYLLCRNRFHLLLSNLVWRLKVDSRILVHLFNPEPLGKWLSYRRNLK